MLLPRFHVKTQVSEPPASHLNVSGLPRQRSSLAEHALAFGNLHGSQPSRSRLCRAVWYDVNIGKLGSASANAQISVTSAAVKTAVKITIGGASRQRRRICSMCGAFVVKIGASEQAVLLKRKIPNSAFAAVAGTFKCISGHVTA